jgi:hypothetical protein
LRGGPEKQVGGGNHAGRVAQQRCQLLTAVRVQAAVRDGVAELTEQRPTRLAPLSQGQQ